MVSWKTSGLLENKWSLGKQVVSWKTSGLLENKWSLGKQVVSWKTSGLLENKWSLVEIVCVSRQSFFIKWTLKGIISYIKKRRCQYGHH